AFSLREAGADQIVSCRKAIDAVNAAIIGRIRIWTHAGNSARRLAALINPGQPNLLFNQRLATRIGRAPGDHAAALESDFLVLDGFTVGEIDRFGAPTERVFARRNEARRDGGECVPSSLKSREPESPVLIRLYPQPRTPVPSPHRIFRLQNHNHTPRRLAFQRDAA